MTIGFQLFMVLPFFMALSFFGMYEARAGRLLMNAPFQLPAIPNFPFPSFPGIPGILFLHYFLDWFRRWASYFPIRLMVLSCPQTSYCHALQPLKLRSQDFLCLLLSVSCQEFLLNVSGTNAIARCCQHRRINMLILNYMDKILACYGLGGREVLYIFWL